MNVYKTPHDAASYAAKKLAHRFWQDRIADMLSHTCRLASRDGSTPISAHNIRIDRVARDWPRSGSIMATRDDGKRFRLYMSGRNFKTEAL